MGGPIGSDGIISRIQIDTLKEQIRRDFYLIILTCQGKKSLFLQVSSEAPRQKYERKIQTSYYIYPLAQPGLKRGAKQCVSPAAGFSCPSQWFASILS
jgi:hypothetical protein